MKNEKPMKRQTKVAIALCAALFFGAPVALTVGMAIGTVSAIPEIRKLSKVAKDSEAQLLLVERQLIERNPSHE